MRISRVLGSVARLNHAHAFGRGQPARAAKRLAISCFPKWRRKVLRLGTSSSVASRGTRPQSSSPTPADRRLSRSLTEPSQAIALQMIMRERTLRGQTRTFRSGCIEPANIAGRAMRRVSFRPQVWPIGDHPESSVLCHSNCSPYRGRCHCNLRKSFLRSRPTALRSCRTRFRSWGQTRFEIVRLVQGSRMVCRSLSTS